MRIKIGDRVRFLDEVGEGTVVCIEGNYATVADDDDFEQNYPMNQLVVMRSDWVREVQVDKPKEAYLGPKKKSHETDIKVVEIDLHIHQLIDNQSGLSTYDMLKIQLNRVKSEMAKAQKRKVKKLVFIHGVGEGVLREEVWKLLRNYEKVNIYDADFLRYGRGATAVEFYTH